MIQLAYVSSTLGSLSDSDLRDILKTSREKNARLGVTGLLLYKDGNVLQVLEGEAESVLPLYETIVNDPRHRGVIKMYVKQIETRDFGDWTMGFRNLRAQPLSAAQATSAVLEPDFDIRTLGESQAAMLVSLFRRNQR